MGKRGIDETGDNCSESLRDSVDSQYEAVNEHMDRERWDEDS